MGVFRGQPRTLHKGRDPSASDFLELPNMLHGLTQNDQIRHGNTYGRHVLGGQPRHCILYKYVVRFVSDSGVSCTADMRSVIFCKFYRYKLSSVIIYQGECTGQSAQPCSCATVAPTTVSSIHPIRKQSRQQLQQQ